MASTPATPPSHEGVSVGTTAHHDAVAGVADEPTATTLPYAVCVLNVHGCLNAGAIMRAATLCGCRKVVVFGRRKYDKRSAVGAHHYIDVERVEGLVRDSSSGAPQKTHLSEEDYELCPEAFYECMSQGGYLPVFIEQCADSLVLSDENVARILRHPLVAGGGGGSGPGGGLMPCFIFGNEQTGIPASIIATRARFPVSFAVELRQLGPLESFNVSSCASIVLYRVMECYLSFLPAPVQAKRNDTRAGATQDAEEAKG